jgi:predicted amidohydrolase
MTKRPIKIAAAQSLISTDVHGNGREIRGLMQQAKAEDAALVHFPEGAISGYTKSQIKGWDRFDWNSLKGELELTAHLARELGLWVVLGSGHRLTAPNRPHNSLYIINGRGELATRYDKQFCSNTEITKFYTPGRADCVFEVEGWRFGCALCIEIHFPELFLRYADLGVDCLLFSSYSEDPVYGIIAQGYAAIHNYWVSVSVPTQTSHALSSRLISPSGEVQSTASPSISGLAVDWLDPDCPKWKIALHHARPWRARAREGTIYREHYVHDPRSEKKTMF